MDAITRWNDPPIFQYLDAACQYLDAAWSDMLLAGHLLIGATLSLTIFSGLTSSEWFSWWWDLTAFPILVVAFSFYGIDTLVQHNRRTRRSVLVTDQQLLEWVRAHLVLTFGVQGPDSREIQFLLYSVRNRRTGPQTYEYRLFLCPKRKSVSEDVAFAFSDESATATMERGACPLYNVEGHVHAGQVCYSQVTPRGGFVAADLADRECRECRQCTVTWKPTTGTGAGHSAHASPTITNDPGGNKDEFSNVIFGTASDHGCFPRATTLEQHAETPTRDAKHVGTELK